MQNTCNPLIIIFLREVKINLASYICTCSELYKFIEETRICTIITMQSYLHMLPLSMYSIRTCSY